MGQLVFLIGDCFARAVGNAAKTGSRSGQFSSGPGDGTDQRLQTTGNFIKRLAKFSELVSGIDTDLSRQVPICYFIGSVMQMIDADNCGTLPDFGNFRITPKEMYDHYLGVQELMPFARGVSAKTYDFDAAGNETFTDFDRMMRIVLDAGYRGYVGVEYEGRAIEDVEGIRLTKALLEKTRAILQDEYPSV